jgi:hypothetical protein
LTGKGEEAGLGGLLHLSWDSLLAALPADTHLLLDPVAIDRFLDELDGSPPNWAVLYGGGHHDPRYDDRLFAFNRERDAIRAGRPVLSWTITFVWSGEVGGYDAKTGRYPVALGPKFISTRWGLVRFKPEEVPGNLALVGNEAQRKELERALERRRALEIDVVMTGRLVPEESLVYDFSHDEEGQGVIMPFVRVNRVDFLLPAREDEGEKRQVHP